MEDLHVCKGQIEVKSKTLVAFVFGNEDAQKKLLFYYPIRGHDFGCIINICIATVLHPRLKFQTQNNIGLSDSTILKIKGYFRNVYERYTLAYNEIERNENSGTQNLGPDDPRPSIQITKISAPKFLSNCSRSVVDEFKKYPSEEQADGSMGVGEFCQNRKMVFPILYRMVKDFLSTPAISVPSKVLFSKIADVVTTKRNRLLCNTIKNLAIFKSRGVISTETRLVFDREEGFGDVMETPKVSENEVKQYMILVAFRILVQHWLY